MSSKSFKNGIQVEKKEGGTPSSQRSRVKSIESEVSGTLKECSSIKLRGRNVELKVSSQTNDDADIIETPSPKNHSEADDLESEESSPSVRDCSPTKLSLSISSEKNQVDETPEFEVEALVAKHVIEKGKGKKNPVHYQVKWKGYEELSWEPASNLHCDDLIQAFENSIKNYAARSSKENSPVVRRASMHRAAKSSPKPSISGDSVSSIKKQSRQTSVQNAKKSNHQASFSQQTAEEIFGALVAKKLALLSSDVSGTVQLEILKIINKANQ